MHGACPLVVLELVKLKSIFGCSMRINILFDQEFLECGYWPAADAAAAAATAPAASSAADGADAAPAAPVAAAAAYTMAGAACDQEEFLGKDKCSEYKQAEMADEEEAVAGEMLRELADQIAESPPAGSSIEDTAAPATRDEKKNTRHWAAWTHAEEESFFHALRRCGKNFEKITNRVPSKNKDQVRHYYYRVIKRMNKLLGPGLVLDARNPHDVNAAMLRWWALMEKQGCSAAKLRHKPKRRKMFVTALEQQLLADRRKAKRKQASGTQASAVQASAAPATASPVSAAPAPAAVATGIQDAPVCELPSTTGASLSSPACVNDACVPCPSATGVVSAASGSRGSPGSGRDNMPVAAGPGGEGKGGAGEEQKEGHEAKRGGGEEGTGGGDGKGSGFAEGKGTGEKRGGGVGEGKGGGGEVKTSGGEKKGAASGEGKGSIDRKAGGLGDSKGVVERKGGLSGEGKAGGGRKVGGLGSKKEGASPKNSGHKSKKGAAVVIGNICNVSEVSGAKSTTKVARNAPRQPARRPRPKKDHIEIMTGSQEPSSINMWENVMCGVRLVAEAAAQLEQQAMVDQVSELDEERRISGQMESVHHKPVTQTALLNQKGGTINQTSDHLLQEGVHTLQDGVSRSEHEDGIGTSHAVIASSSMGSEELGLLQQPGNRPSSAATIRELPLCECDNAASGRVDITKDSAANGLGSANADLGAEKVKLQLYPIDDITRRSLAKEGYNPYLELTLKGRKSISAVVSHLLRKWVRKGNDAVATRIDIRRASPPTAESTGRIIVSSWQDGELRLFPYGVSPSTLQSAKFSWGKEHGSVTASDVGKVVGSLKPQTFRLRYAWVSYLSDVQVSGQSSAPAERLGSVSEDIQANAAMKPPGAQPAELSTQMTAMQRQPVTQKQSGQHITILQLSALSTIQTTREGFQGASIPTSPRGMDGINVSAPKESCPHCGCSGCSKDESQAVTGINLAPEERHNNSTGSAVQATAKEVDSTNTTSVPSRREAPVMLGRASEQTELEQTGGLVHGGKVEGSDGEKVTGCQEIGTAKDKAACRDAQAIGDAANGRLTFGKSTEASRMAIDQAMRPKFSAKRFCSAGQAEENQILKMSTGVQEASHVAATTPAATIEEMPAARCAWAYEQSNDGFGRRSWDVAENLGNRGYMVEGGLSSLGLDSALSLPSLDTTQTTPSPSCQPKGVLGASSTSATACTASSGAVPSAHVGTVERGCFVVPSSIGNSALGKTPPSDADPGLQGSVHSENIPGNSMSWIDSLSDMSLGDLLTDTLCGNGPGSVEGPSGNSLVVTPTGMATAALSVADLHSPHYIQHDRKFAYSRQISQISGPLPQRRLFAGGVMTGNTECDRSKGSRGSDPLPSSGKQSLAEEGIPRQSKEKSSNASLPSLLREEGTCYGLGFDTPAGSAVAVEPIAYGTCDGGLDFSTPARPAVPSSSQSVSNRGELAADGVLTEGHNSGDVTAKTNHSVPSVRAEGAPETIEAGAGKQFDSGENWSSSKQSEKRQLAAGAQAGAGLELHSNVLPGDSLVIGEDVGFPSTGSLGNELLFGSDFSLDGSSGLSLLRNIIGTTSTGMETPTHPLCPLPTPVSQPFPMTSLTSPGVNMLSSGKSSAVAAVSVAMGAQGMHRAGTSMSAGDHDVTPKDTGKCTLSSGAICPQQKRTAATEKDVHTDSEGLVSMGGGFSEHPPEIAAHIGIKSIDNNNNNNNHNSAREERSNVSKVRISHEVIGRNKSTSTSGPCFPNDSNLQDRSAIGAVTAHKLPSVRDVGVGMTPDHPGVALESEQRVRHEEEPNQPPPNKSGHQDGQIIGRRTAAGLSEDGALNPTKGEASKLGQTGKVGLRVSGTESPSKCKMKDVKVIAGRAKQPPVKADPNVWVPERPFQSLFASLPTNKQKDEMEFEKGSCRTKSRVATADKGGKERGVKAVPSNKGEASRGGGSSAPKTSKAGPKLESKRVNKKEMSKSSDAVKLKGASPEKMGCTGWGEGVKRQRTGMQTMRKIPAGTKDGSTVNDHVDGEDGEAKEAASAVGCGATSAGKCQFPTALIEPPRVGCNPPLWSCSIPAPASP
ncbi:hypothetical protein CBR_g26407 [Chara braunii]|uniref:SANT domain-containing protein n=1 Tax=Chara braunii TaxID=69332 RepID=A0A388L7X0_CHABU|nr:hypothetical protein CBR_g26407 [Chara braunii]|eukprot:GBG78378.1 hypothetical protein CBR_g26407 [Chara braunii]